MADPMKYEAIYAAQRHALGAPFPAIIDLIDTLPKGLDVLDLGAGQGRDALPIARRGHRVVAVDIAPTGLMQLAEDAAGLKVETVVADLNTYAPEGQFDVAILDRTLHMLEPVRRLSVLNRLIPHIRPNGMILIADEVKNLVHFGAFFDDLDGWIVFKDQKGFLFVQAPPERK